MAFGDGCTNISPIHAILSLRPNNYFEIKLTGVDRAVKLTVALPNVDGIAQAHRQPVPETQFDAQVNEGVAVAIHTVRELSYVRIWSGERGGEFRVQLSSVARTDGSERLRSVRKRERQG